MRNRSHRAVFLTLAITLFISCSQPLSSKEPVKILFIGSSYFNYNNLPEIFRQLSEQGGEVVHIEHHIPSGLFLADHVEHALTRSKIKSKRWDYVIIQGVGIVMAYPDSITQHTFHPAMKSLMKSITRNSSSTKTVFCMPWAYEDGMAWKEGWGDNYDEMQQKIINTTMQYSEKMGFIVAPVGVAWSNVLKENGYPLHYLHLSDWNHPTKRGSYLMACLLYSTIFQESTVAIPYNAGLEQKEALYLREMGSNTVLDSIQHWNIPTIPE